MLPLVGACILQVAIGRCLHLTGYHRLVPASYMLPLVGACILHVAIGWCLHLTGYHWLVPASYMLPLVGACILHVTIGWCLHLTGYHWLHSRLTKISVCSGNAFCFLRTKMLFYVQLVFHKLTCSVPLFVSDTINPDSDLLTTLTRIVRNK